MKNLILTALFVASVVLSVVDNKASANVIVGPIPTAIGSIGGASNPPQPSTWGLQFTANDYSHLVAFTFTQKGSQFGSNNVGTITLKDVTSNTTVDSWSVPLVPGFAPVANTLSFSGEDLLNSGDKYQLLYTQTAGDYSNEVLVSIGSGNFAPYQNSDISITNGIENGNSSNSIWFAFNNLTTVPEPSTFAMLGLGGLVLAIRRRQAVA